MSSVASPSGKVDKVESGCFKDCRDLNSEKYTQFYFKYTMMLKWSDQFLILQVLCQYLQQKCNVLNSNQDIQIK